MLYHGFLGICTLSVVICIHEGEARGIHITTRNCTMIQLANVSQTVGDPLATAKALVVLATDVFSLS